MTTQEFYQRVQHIELTTGVRPPVLDVPADRWREFLLDLYCGVDLYVQEQLGHPYMPVYVEGVRACPGIT